MESKRARYVWVCTKRRPDDHKKGSCGARGGEELARVLKSAVTKANVDARVCTSGCFDLCWVGASVSVMPDNVFLKEITLADVPALVAAIDGDAPLAECEALRRHFVQDEDWVDPSATTDKPAP